MKCTHLGLLLVGSILAACGGDDAPDQVDIAGGPDAAPADLNGTDDLVDCTLGGPETKWCVPPGNREPGHWRFDFDCPKTSLWRVEMSADPNSAELLVAGTTVASYGESAPPTLLHEVNFASLEVAHQCTAFVEILEPLSFSLTLTELEGALDAFGCDEKCLSDSDAGASRGCDCSSTCHDACSDSGVDCGLPCNRDVPDYQCPYYETGVLANNDCSYYADDTGVFEHVGSCYRCGDGQQCCYTEGRDNGTGSFDICPPLDPGPNDPDPYGCSGISDHCACDVVPLCGCMAEVGALALCGECIGEDPLDVLSCNAKGSDATFCARAQAAAQNGFSWCAIVGDPMACFNRPFGL